MKVRYFGEPPATDVAVELRSGAGAGHWQVPEETPVAFVYNQRNYAVMLATPFDLQDFAVGFSLTERVVDAVEEITAIDIHQSERGIELHIKIAPALVERLDIRQRRRNVVGRAGCGICGLENAGAFFETLPRVSDAKVSLNPATLPRALEGLRKHQPLYEKTRTVHAAAWATLDGEILLAREDVGRHNALDKLLGKMAQSEVSISNGFVLVSSRCSYEIIEKSARLGVVAVAAVSAPTAFAVRKAHEANIALYCRDGSTFVEVLG